MKLNGFGSVCNFLNLPELKWPLMTAASTGLIQFALSRGSNRYVSLLSRVSYYPAGAALLNLGPLLLAGLVALAAVRYFKPAAYFPIPLRFFPLGEYRSLHADVDQKISKDQSDVTSQIYSFGDSNYTAQICSTFPPGYANARKFFCDAFACVGAASPNPIVAIADGYGWRPADQACAREMIDGFINYLQKQSNEGTDHLVMDAVLYAQEEIVKKNPDLHCHAKFLGGMIFTANGKRYFTYVRCGDSKLFLLRRDKITELTKPALSSFLDVSSSSGGRFGTSRAEEDKTEYIERIEVTEGDRLILMTVGVHATLFCKSLDQSEDPRIIDEGKLKQLQVIYDENEKPSASRFSYLIMEHVKKFTGGFDHATVLIVDVNQSDAVKS